MQRLYGHVLCTLLNAQVFVFWSLGLLTAIGGQDAFMPQKGYALLLGRKKTESPQHPLFKFNHFFAVARKMANARREIITIFGLLYGCTCWRQMDF